MATFGEMVQQFREKLGLTQTALADKAGVSLRSIQGWEQNRRRPVSEDFFRLVKALGVPADTFAVAEGLDSQSKKKPARKGR